VSNRVRTCRRSGLSPLLCILTLEPWESSDCIGTVIEKARVTGQSNSSTMRLVHS
jgi:hypothetical protein